MPSAVAARRAAAGVPAPPCASARRPDPNAMRDWPRRALIALVRGYQLLLSSWLGSSCRYEPTCSGYAAEALKAHGAAAGSWLALRRLLRCHPWCEGGCDPVPPHAPWPFTARRRDAPPAQAGAGCRRAARRSPSFRSPPLP